MIFYFEFFPWFFFKYILLLKELLFPLGVNAFLFSKNFLNPPSSQVICLGPKCLGIESIILSPFVFALKNDSVDNCLVKDCNLLYFLLDWDSFSVFTVTGLLFIILFVLRLNLFLLFDY